MKRENTLVHFLDIHKVDRMALTRPLIEACESYIKHTVKHLGEDITVRNPIDIAEIKRLNILLNKKESAIKKLEKEIASLYNQGYSKNDIHPKAVII